jgi:tryptophan synthase alpha subunit
MKTFVYIGAARRFANSVEMPLTKLSFKGVDGFEVGPPLSQPLGQTRLDGSRGQASNLNEGIQVVEPLLYYP